MKLYAIGDIHGCYREMLDLLDLIREDCGDDDCKIVFVGDYVDRGPDSAMVVQHLVSLRANPEPGSEFVFLKGNHEDMLIKAWSGEGTRDDKDMFYYNGGYKTKASYEELNLIYKDHETFYNSLPRYHRHEDFFFVHAGLAPLVDKKIEEATEFYSWLDHDPCLWSRSWNDHDGEFPEGVFVVHGHTPVPDVTFHTNQVNIDTGCVFGKPDRVGYGLLTAVRLDGRTREEIQVLQVKRKY